MIGVAGGTGSGKTTLVRKLGERFPKSSFIAITLRESYSADHNNWGGMLYDTRLDKPFFAPLDADGHYAPYEIRAIVDRFGDNPAAMKQAGIAYATDQIIDLYANGITNVHVYSMNKPDVAGKIQQNLSDILGK